MADHTAIEWTDATWQPITGCSIVSPGCTNCYAMRLAGTRLRDHPSRRGLTRDSKAGPVWTGEVRFNEDWLDQPLRWRRPRRIFVCAHGDLFAEGVPDAWIDRVFSVMCRSRRHTFQVLTKRPDRARDYLRRFKPCRVATGFITRDGEEPTSYGGPVKTPIFGADRWPLPNVWLGVSVEDQMRADERIPALLATPATKRFISAEPLLGPVDLKGWLPSVIQRVGGLSGKTGGPPPKLDWVIAGGESGHGARPMHPDWATSLRNQCTAAGVPFFFKQWGEWIAGDELASEQQEAVELGERRLLTWDAGRKRAGNREYEFHSDGTTLIRVGKKAAGRLLDGRGHSEFPDA